MEGLHRNKHGERRALLRFPEDLEVEGKNQDSLSNTTLAKRKWRRRFENYNI
jgi:hypothetical protein